MLYKPAMETLQDLVSTAVQNHTGSVAVTFDDGSVKSNITYKEMWHRADLICEVLRSRGVHNETVGLCMPQLPDLPAVLLGILQAPASFYCFDGDGPDFICQSLGNLGVQYVLVHMDWLQKVDSIIHTLHGMVTPCMELFEFGLVLMSLPVNRKKQEQTTPLAYCITTSGTTSRPKVVQVPHSCIVSNIINIRNIFKLTSDDVCFLTSPLTFDPSIVEMFVALTSGSTLLITSDEVKASPKKLMDILHRRNHVSILQMTPSQFLRFGSETLQTTILSAYSPVRVLALGGEHFPPLSRLQSSMSSDCRAKFYNLYGITEVSCWATCFGFDATYFEDPENEVPLGDVLDGTEVKVINSSGHEITTGEGELLIGSCDRICILNEETDTLTDSRTVWRNTGDIVDVHSNGRIFFKGRCDSQLKRHGKRLNTAAIENAVLKTKSVADCRVISHGDRLLLFVVAEDSQELRQPAGFQREVRLLLQRAFPNQYQPDGIVVVDAIPVTKHGKTDRQQLLSLWDDPVNKLKQPLAHNVDELCCTLWKDQLNLTDVEITRQSFDKEDKFVLLGGDSFKAVNVVNTIERLTGADNPLLFETLLDRTFDDFTKEVRKAVYSMRTSDEESKPCDQLELRLQMYSPVKKSLNMEPRFVELKDVIEKDNTIGVDSDTEAAVETLKAPLGLVGQLGDSCELIVENTDDYQPKKDISETFAGDVSMAISDASHRRLRDIPMGDNSLELSWMYDTGKCVDASPMVAVNSSGCRAVFVGSHSHAVCAIDLMTGSELWRTQLGDRIESSACLSRCGRWVVVGCYDNCVYTLCSMSGVVKWKFITGNSVKCSPTLDPVTSHIIIGSHDHNLYALDIESETCAWKCRLRSGSVFSSPRVSCHQRRIYVGTLGSKLHSVNADTGEIVWSHNLEKPIFSSPAENKSCIVVGCVDNNIYCFSHQGQKMWTFPTGSPVFSSPAITTIPCSSPGEVVLIGSHDNHLYCLSMDGALVWKFLADSPVYATPVVSFQEAHQRGRKLKNEIGGSSCSTNSQDAVDFEEEYRHRELQLQTELSNCISFSGDPMSVKNMSNMQDHDESVLQKFSAQINKSFECITCNTQTKSVHISKEELPLKKPKLDLNSKYFEDSNEPKFGLSSESIKDYISTCHVNPSVQEDPREAPGRPMVCVASTKGTLYLLDSVSGHPTASRQLPGEVFSSPVVVDGRVVVGCRDNNVYCYRSVSTS